MKSKILFAVLALAAILGTVSVHADQHPNLDRGFDANKVYQFGDVDTVDLMNGRLTLHIPIGQSYPVSSSFSYGLSLTYNSNLWDYVGLFVGVDTCVEANLAEDWNAGAGWLLSFGRLDYRSAQGDWMYYTPDGADHRFYPTLHDGENTASGIFYTRDSTYMRLRLEDGVSPRRATVESPDGTRHIFSEDGYGSRNYRLTTIADARNDAWGNPINKVTITYYDANTPGRDPRKHWVITDTTGRSQTIYFTAMSAEPAEVVDEVVLSAFGGNATHYDFSYTTTSTTRPCKETCRQSTDQDWTVTLALLTQVAIKKADGALLEQWDMAGYNTYLSRTYCTLPAGDIPGTINQLRLPTQATMEFGYEDHLINLSLEPPDCTSDPLGCAEHDAIKIATGVITKTVTDPVANATGSWTYSRYSHTGDYGTYPNLRMVNDELVTLVTNPAGDTAAHFFQTYTSPSGAGGWDYALPLTTLRSADNGGRFLSSEQYAGTATVSGCGRSPCLLSGSIRRSQYVKYEADNTTTKDMNRRESSARTVYQDDVVNSVPRETAVVRTLFDNLGHYKQTATEGNFGSGNVRTIYTAYTSRPSTSSPWILTTSSYTAQTENSVTARQDTCFDPATGFLRAKRTLVGTSAGAGDLLVVYTPDASGNPVTEQYFGGDGGSIPTGYCSYPGSVLSDDQYRILHTYQYGVRRTSEYADGSGVSMGFKSLDLDIDASTGLASASRDTAGLATGYLYDGLGRLTWAMPASGHGDYTHFQYLRSGTCATGAKVEKCTRANGSSTSNECTTTVSPCSSLSGSTTRAAWAFDGLGRTWYEYTLLPSGWNQRRTTTNMMGWTTAVSEWQPAGTSGTSLRSTTYSSFDPFGRPGNVTAADGKTTTFTYAGIRQVDRIVKVYTSIGGAPAERDALTTEVYDRQGRLASVTEPSGANGSPVTTTYGYDVGNRLTTVSTTSGVNQTRTFIYDRRGLLVTERLPEIGSSGNGTVTHSKYDARGHARRLQDGAHDLALTYDRAERVTQLAQANAAGDPGTPVLKTFGFATANATNNWRKGKLEIATAANPDLASASVVETYTYGGVGGRVSARETKVEGRTITQAFTWNQLGLLASVGYPDDAAIADPSRTVSYTYSNGFLTAVPSYINGITYYRNTMTNQVTNANATRVTYGKDPDDMQRPATITLQRTADASTLWATGTYLYDGAGNIKSIGSDTYTHDLVSRLLLGTTSSAAKRQCATFDAFGNVTALGTGTTTCTPSAVSVSSSTNRLSSPVRYDAAGNMTEWGGNTYTWDRDNKVLGTTGTGINRSYLYSADGERSVDRNNLDSTRTLWIRDLSGQVLREYTRTGAGTWSWSKDYVYRGVQPIATVTSSGTRYLHLDHLGSIRRATDTQATPQLVAAATRDFYPFGLEATTATDPERLRFTGHERDTTGLDYMHARYCNPVVARFLSVDPGRDWNPKAPQSWNMYAYTQNRPLLLVDRTGRYAEDVHYYLTAYLAFQAGHDLKSAFEIAAANQGVDVDRPAGIASSLSDRTSFDLHFMSRDQAAGLVMAVSSNQELGAALHSYQDSFAHEGFYWPLGHAMKGLSPDNPALTEASQAKAMAMALGTFMALGGRPSALNRSFLATIFAIKSESRRRELLAAALGYAFFKRLASEEDKWLLLPNDIPFRGSGFVSADNVRH